MALLMPFYWRRVKDSNLRAPVGAAGLANRWFHPLTQHGTTGAACRICTGIIRSGACVHLAAACDGGRSFDTSAHVSNKCCRRLRVCGTVVSSTLVGFADLMVYRSAIVVSCGPFQKPHDCPPTGARFPLRRSPPRKGRRRIGLPSPLCTRMVSNHLTPGYEPDALPLSYWCIRAAGASPSCCR